MVRGEKVWYNLYKESTTNREETYKLYHYCYHYLSLLLKALLHVVRELAPVHCTLLYTKEYTKVTSVCCPAGAQWKVRSVGLRLLLAFSWPI